MPDTTIKLANATRLQRQQSYLMAVAGHDLRQSLQVILMAVDHLSPKLASADRNYAEMAMAEIGVLGRGLSDLALASQFTCESMMAPRLESFALEDVLDQVAASWRFHANLKGLRIRVASGFNTVVSDRAIVETILRNLIGNAIKYTDRGGVAIKCRQRREMVHIDVWDTGTGICGSQLEAIMRPFHQSDATRGGLGLGLAIAKHSAELIGGALEVTSKVGRGSRFTLVLPQCIEQKASASHEERYGAAGRLSR
jgi:signal transduction histidine kinase